MSALVENQKLRVRYIAFPFSTCAKELFCDAGASVSEILKHLQPRAELRRAASVQVDSIPISPIYWDEFRPVPGAFVTVRMLPAGGDVLRTVLSVGVLIGAIVLASFVPVSILGSQLLGQIAYGLVVGGVATAGGLLINALVPVAQPQLSASSISGAATRDTIDDTPSYSLTGGQNAARPYQPFPVVLGRHRVVPPLGANSYTELVGNEQYLRMLFIWGHGPITLSDIKIGDVPIEEFQDVELEHRYGYAADAPLSLFPNIVVEEALQIQLRNSDGYIERTTQEDIDEILLEVGFPQGLVNITVDPTTGSQTANTMSVEFEVEYKDIGAGSYTSAGTFTVSGRTRSLVRHGFRLVLPSRGQYNVRMRRNTADADITSGEASVSVWTILRNVTNDDPINMTGIAKTAIRIRATNQLSGTIQNLSGVVYKLIRDYDPIGGTWSVEENTATSNPAAIMRYVLQGAPHRRSNLITDAKIDLTTLEDWYTFCETQGFTFNFVCESRQSIADILTMIASSGRASRILNDGKWSVLIDRTQNTPVQIFTPRNSREFSATKVYGGTPDAINVRFVNASQDWKQDERIVYNDGFDDSNAVNVLQMEFPGTTDSDLIYRLARYRIAEIKLRPERYKLKTDIEHLVCTRGDLVRVNHDVTRWGLGTARIIGITETATHITAIAIDDQLEMIAGNSYSIRIRHTDGTMTSYPIDTVSGFNSTLTFTTPVEKTGSYPAVQNLFMFGLVETESQLVLVNGITYDGDDAIFDFVDYSEAIYSADTETIPEFETGITIPPQEVAPIIESVRSDETVLKKTAGGDLVIRMLVSLRISANRDDLTGIEVQYRPVGSAGPYAGVIISEDANEASLEDVQQGETYEVRSRYRRPASLGKWSGSINHTVVGLSTLPDDITAVWLEGDILRWSYPERPLDFLGFQVRYNDGTNLKWSDGKPLHNGFITQTDFNISGVPRGTKTFLVAVYDLAQNRSEHVAFTIRDIGDVIVNNILDSVDHAALGFPGTITNGQIVSGELRPTGSGDPMWRLPLTLPLWSSDLSDPMWTNIFNEMTYTFIYTPDAADIDGSLKITHNIVSPNYKIEYGVASEGPFWTGDSNTFWTGDSNPFWSTLTSALKIFPGEIFPIVAQDYFFKLTVFQNANLSQVIALTLIIDVPDEIEYVNDVSLASGGTRIPITKSFRQIRNVGITLHDTGTAITAKIQDKDESLGPLVQAFDSGGTGVTATVDAIVQGIKGV